MMHPLLPISVPALLFLTLLSHSPTLASSSSNPPNTHSNLHTTKIHYHPLLSPTPLPLAELAYNPLFPDDSSSARIISFTPPSVPASLSSSSSSSSESSESAKPQTAVDLDPTHLLRIGFLDPSGRNLSAPSTLVSVGVFAEGLEGRFRVLLKGGDGRGGERLWGSVGYYATKNVNVENKNGKSENGGSTSNNNNKAGTAPLPAVDIIRAAEAPRPVLNKPVVVSAEGKVVREGEGEGEKTFLQKYWWVFLGAAVLAMAGGGDAK